MRADSSGMSRDEKRAALFAIQGGTCATCDATTRLEADHDHKTGLLRGLLCRSCNNMEGKTRSRLFRYFSADVLTRFDAYRANPPAGTAWFWDFPDDWSQDDTAAMYKNGLTLAEYVLSVRPARHPAHVLATRFGARRDT